MARIDYKQEMKWVQQDIYKAGKMLVSANMRLEGTKYSSDMKKVMEGLSSLNSRLIEELKKL